MGGGGGKEVGDSDLMNFKWGGGPKGVGVWMENYSYYAGRGRVAGWNVQCGRGG